MGRSLEAQRPHSFRTLQYFTPRCRSAVLAVRVALVLLFIALFYERRLFHSYRNDLRAKYSPTEFGTPEAALWRTGIAEPELPQQLLDHREQWKVLGSGWEGQTFTFNGSVIKTFVPGRSPFRNCISRSPTVRWPTEIPASLEFGGAWNPNRQTLVDASTNTADRTLGFLPVRGYFMISPTAGAPPEWHLVTPLLPGGNLNHLAKKLHQKHAHNDFRHIDTIYRPAFTKLLQTLASLHSQGFCHDDIKPGNIFVETDQSWILGDLGNVRHINHPYHSSGIWLRDNKQLADCRANDVVRALKTYLQFVRGATGDSAAFDTPFFERKEGLSLLFWSVLANAAEMSAAEMGTLSEVFHPGFILDSSSNDDANKRQPLPSEFSLGRRKSLSNAVDEALQTSVDERAARWAAMTRILGVPVGAC